MVVPVRSCSDNVCGEQCDISLLGKVPYLPTDDNDDDDV
jgi:hypothetical protein